MKQTFKQITFCIALLWSTYGLAQTTTQTCQAISDKKITHFFDQWNEALKNKNLDTIVNSYDKNAILFPTLSSTPRTNHQEIHDYFVDFIKRSPVATIDQRTIRMGCNWATDTGLYTFKITDATGTHLIHARYSLVYEYVNGQWLIIHHHSSIIPVMSDVKKSFDPNF